MKRLVAQDYNSFPGVKSFDTPRSITSPEKMLRQYRQIMQNLQLSSSILFLMHL